MPSTRPGFETKQDNNGTERVLLSILIEEILLGYFYLLNKREVLRGDSLSTFWEMDTYHLYTLLHWERANMKNEPETNHVGGTEEHPQVTGEQHIPRDPEITNLFPEYDDPENEGEL
jgi:hypothetical protein